MKAINRLLAKMVDFLIGNSVTIEKRLEDEKIQVEWIDKTAVIKMPQLYWVGSWGAMLELVRSGELSDALYIVVDFSNVKFIGDGSAETYILRREFRGSGGRDVIHVAMPASVRRMYEMTMTEELLENERIRDFSSLDDALDFIAS